MKKIKFLALLALVFGAFGLNSALAQSDDDGDEPPPPMMSQFDDDGNSEVEGQSSTVTIDGEESYDSGESTSSSGSSYSGSESRERVRVYSGKHDGNNVIKDSKRD